MSRCTRCVLPVARKLLILKVVNTRHVFSRLKLKNQQQKSYHDQHGKPLLPLHSQRVVRLQTDRGYQKVGVVNPLHNHSRTCWNLKERSTVETEDISCLFQNRLLLNVPALQQLISIHPMFLPPMWYHLVYSHHLVPSLLWTRKPDLVVIRESSEVSCENPVPQRDMLRDMEGRLNQIQSSKTLWLDNKAFTYELFFFFSLSLLFEETAFN